VRRPRRASQGSGGGGPEPSRRVAQIEALLRRAHEEALENEAELDRVRAALRALEVNQAEMQHVAARLAASNAEAAELMAEVEQRNQSLREANQELARANANAAELMALVELREDENQRLNRSLSGANARAAELVAERELQLEEMEQLNRKLLGEISERRRAEQDKAEMAERLRIANGELDRLATLDSLTELLNRRGLDRHLVTELHRAQRSGTRIGVLFADFDDFKTVNQRFGHSGGDEALREVGRRLRASLRATDHLARIGGDEFLALLPAADPDVLRTVAARFHACPAHTPVRIHDADVTITVSVGAALLPPEVVSIDGILGLTRGALKASKEGGKNRVTILE